MISVFKKRLLFLPVFAVFAAGCSCAGAQAALLLEQPYGFFGILNPTGHNAMYLERVCAETPTRLRRCLAGEQGAVIARYQGIEGYDWIAIPLVPYLYSVEKADDVPAYADKKAVAELRSRYHEQHLLNLGTKLRAGNMLHGGWNELIGVAYERRMFAFEFATTPEQDDALIARLNDSANRSHFQLLYNNCADFSRQILDDYFPEAFKRSFLPDAGMTTPKQVTYKLERYAREHPETELKVFEIDQIPGSRRRSMGNKDVAESLATTGYAIPIAVMNPYLAAGLFADYAFRGHFHLVPKKRQVLTPANLAALTRPRPPAQNRGSASVQVRGAAGGGMQEAHAATSAHSGLGESKEPNE
jgi:hypothetical protein